MNKRNASLSMLIVLFIITFLGYIILSGGSVNRPFSRYPQIDIETVEDISTTSIVNPEPSIPSIPFDFPTGSGGIPGELSFIIFLLISGVFLITIIFFTGYVGLNIAKKVLSYEKVEKSGRQDSNKNRKIIKTDIEKTLTLRLVIDRIIDDLRKLNEENSSEIRLGLISGFNYLDKGLSYFLNLARPSYLTPLEYATDHIKSFDKPYLDSSKLLIIVKRFYEAAYRKKTPTFEEVNDLIKNLENLIIEEILDLEIKKFEG